MSNENLGASFSIDTTDLKAGLAQANRLIRESESEFRAAAAGMDDWTQSEEGLTSRINSLNQITEVQRAKVNALQSEYDQLVSNGLDPASREAVELRTKINNETTALNKNEAELKKQTQALEELENGANEAGDAADGMGDKFSGLKAAGGVAVGAIAAVGSACVAAVGAFLGLAESTREARNNMAKVETAFQTAGLSAENAADTMVSLYGIMGDEGAAGEAAQQLAKISQSEADLEANTRILTGVMAEYGASIPLEGLAEGMAATAAMGSVQGSLADALEWQGVNLDDYNAKLATLSTEEERAAYIQETLTGLYGASADAYRENNAEVIAAQEAQAKLNSVINELGAIAEPIMTTIKTLAADLLISIKPFVSLLGEGLTGALNGSAGALDKFSAGVSGILSTLVSKVSDMLPSLVETIVNVTTTLLPQIISSVTAIFPELAKTILQQLPVILEAVISGFSQILTALGEMLPELIPIAIDAVISLAETLIDNIDLIIDAGISLIMGLADGLLTALPQLIDKIPVIIEKLVSAIVNNAPKLLQAGVDLILKLAAGLIQAIPQLVSKIPQIITSLVNGLKEGTQKIAKVGEDVIKGLWDGISNMSSWIANKIKGFGKGVLQGLKDFFQIRSPARRPAKEIGKPFVEGVAKGVDDNKKLAVEAVTEMGKDMLASEIFYLEEKARIEKEKADKEYEERLKNAKDAAEAEKIKQEEINKIAAQEQQEYLDGLKAKAEEERKLYDEAIKAREEKLKEEYENALSIQDDFLKSRESVSGAAFDDTQGIFKTHTLMWNENNIEQTYTLPDFKEDTKRLQNYSGLLDKLMAKYGELPEEVINTLANMSVDDATKYVTAMLNASEEVWNDYVKNFEERQNISEKIGQALFPDKALEDVRETISTLGDALGITVKEDFEDLSKGICTSLDSIRSHANLLLEGDRETKKGSNKGGITVNQNNYYKQAVTGRYEQYKSAKELFTSMRIWEARFI